ncbi:hypothetical protein OHT76_42120 [Streptomyces sp. NBC_00287]|uniref:hypothetical protein n=1 Tax=Streptomyces sp. NBC_00287 TaxID=2975702 RepID=UPI002E2A5576|nr:hypothetical protein [Streptomyces sp. NBC_00287]
MWPGPATAAVATTAATLLTARAQAAPDGVTGANTGTYSGASCTSTTCGTHAAAGAAPRREVEVAVAEAACARRT